MSDEVEVAVLFVEAEQERADLAAILVLAEAAHHHIDGAPVLDLDHRPLPLLVGEFGPLGDDPITTRGLPCTVWMAIFVLRRGYGRVAGGMAGFWVLAAVYEVDLPLPDGAITEQAKATFRDGVLEIAMPAPPASKGRRLEISEGERK